MRNPFQFKRHLHQVFNPPASSAYHSSIAGFRSLGYLFVTGFHVFTWGNLLLPNFERYDDFTHYNVIGILLNAGSYGVDIFFLLSGFLFFETVYKQITTTGSLNVGSLLLNRIARLWPVIAFATLVVWAAGSSACPDPADLLFSINWFMIWYPLRPYCLPITWSVSVDFQWWLMGLPLLYIITLIRGKNKEVWPLRMRDLLFLILAARCFLLWQAFSLNPPIPGNHARDSIPTAALVDLETSIGASMPFNISDPKINETFLHYHTIYHIYANTFSRLIPFLLGLLVGQVYYEHSPLILHLHKHSWIYSLLALVALVAPLPYPMALGTIHLQSLPYFQRNLVVAFQRTVFASGVGFFFVLSISSYTSSKRNYSTSPSSISKVVCYLLSLRVWYPLSQLSYIFSVLVILPVVYSLVPTSLSSLSPALFLIQTLIVVAITFVWSLFVSIQKKIREREGEGEGEGERGGGEGVGRWRGERGEREKRGEEKE